MATLAELKTRIILETNRDDMGVGGDLETALANAISRSIEHYAGELFWFNRKSGTTPTVAATATAALPTGMRVPLTVSYDQVPLLKVDLGDIQHLTATGRPSHWAENEGAIQLYPVPDAVYTLSVQGIADLGVPVTSNEWTTEAEDLIAARTRFLLFRDIFRDREGVQFAAQAEGEALSRLRSETRRRAVTPLRGDVPQAPSSFNITRG